MALKYSPGVHLRHRMKAFGDAQVRRHDLIGWRAISFQYLAAHEVGVHKHETASLDRPGKVPVQHAHALHRMSGGIAHERQIVHRDHGRPRELQRKKVRRMVQIDAPSCRAGAKRDLASCPQNFVGLRHRALERGFGPRNARHGRLSQFAAPPEAILQMNLDIRQRAQLLDQFTRIARDPGRRREQCEGVDRDLHSTRESKGGCTAFTDVFYFGYDCAGAPLYGAKCPQRTILSEQRYGLRSPQIPGSDTGIQAKTTQTRPIVRHPKLARVSVSTSIPERHSYRRRPQELGRAAHGQLSRKSCREERTHPGYWRLRIRNAVHSAPPGILKGSWN